MTKPLTPREYEVLQTMATTGRGSAKETARVLGCSDATVENRAHSAMRKLGAATRLEAVLIWDRMFGRERVTPLTGVAPCASCAGHGFVVGTRR